MRNYTMIVVNSSFGENSPPSLLLFNVFGRHLNSDFQVFIAFKVFVVSVSIIDMKNAKDAV